MCSGSITTRTATGSWIKRQTDGTLTRNSTPLVKLFKQYASTGEDSVGKLDFVSYPSPEAEEEQLPPIGEWMQPTVTTDAKSQAIGGANGNGNGHGTVAAP